MPWLKPFCSLFTSAQSGGIVGIRVGFQGFREQLRPLKAQLKEGIRAGAEELQKRIKEGTLGGSAGGLQKMTFAAPCAWGPAFLCRSSVSPANPHLTLSVHGDRGADDDADSCQEARNNYNQRHLRSRKKATGRPLTPPPPAFISPVCAQLDAFLVAEQAQASAASAEGRSSGDSTAEQRRRAEEAAERRAATIARHQANINRNLQLGKGIGYGPTRKVWVQKDTHPSGGFC